MCNKNKYLESLAIFIQNTVLCPAITAIIQASDDKQTSYWRCALYFMLLELKEEQLF